MYYDPDSFTYGSEIEWGDIRRDIELPEHLGNWEYSETDVINSAKHNYIACDPLGIEPPYGGEINTVPTHTIQGQIDIFKELLTYFTEHNCPPTVSFISHSHVHIHVPGLKDDIVALKKLTAYIKANQQETVKQCLKYYEHPDISKGKGAKAYFKYDGGRLMPNWMCDNIVNYATDFDSYIYLHCAGKDAKSRGRPFRYAINTYCLKHTNTVEFRCFRSACDSKQLKDIFEFCTEFLNAALNTGIDVNTLLTVKDYEFPVMEFNLKEYNIWKSTKWNKNRGKKERLYVPI